MKKIEAIIRLSKFDAIRDALADIGVSFFTLKDVKGFGLQKGEKATYRGSIYDASYIARLQIDIICEADQVDRIVEVISTVGRTGEIGDGKIIVLDLEQVLRIRTGEMDNKAI